MAIAARTASQNCDIYFGFLSGLACRPADSIMAKIQATTTSRVSRAHTLPTRRRGSCSFGVAGKKLALAGRKLKHFPGVGLALTPFSRNTKTSKVTCLAACHCASCCIGLFILSVVHMLEPIQHAKTYVFSRNKFPAEKTLLPL